MPGDRVTITGVFRAVGTRPNPRQRTLRQVFRTYIDVIHFDKVDKDRIASMDPLVSEREYTHEVKMATENAAEVDRRADRCREMAEDPDLYNKLANSIAPSIWELEDVKKGVLLQVRHGMAISPRSNEWCATVGRTTSCVARVEEADRRG